MTDSERGRLLAPNLDDRDWQALVADARALIPTYAPQWTDHHPSDLGMTLIELFAFLVEGLTYRLNRVPEKNYIAFLNLLGISRRPAVPARAFLSFTAAPGAPVLVPKGCQAQTRASDTEAAIVFETDEAVTVLPANLKTALLLAGAKYTNVSKALVAPPARGQSITLQPGESATLALGFDAAPSQQMRLRLRLARPLPQALGTWVYSQGTLAPAAWPALPDVADDTAGLTRREGWLRFTVPSTWASQAPAAWAATPPATPGDSVATAQFWIGLRLANGTGAALTLDIAAVLFNTAQAYNALTVDAPELLGRGNGKAFQSFELARRPLFQRPASDILFEELSVTVGGQPWSRAEDLPPGAANLYRLDPVTGTLDFGDHDPLLNPGGHGSMPPAGAAVLASYRYVAGGVGGNTGAATIRALRTPVAGIVDVSNLAAAEGGADEEAIEETKRRAPELLRKRNRAVTAEDYEALAGEASADVALARCLGPRLQAAAGPGAPPAWQKDDPWAFGALDRAPGNVNLLVLPKAGLADPRPQPSADLLDALRRHLDQRRPLTARLTVGGPRYVPVKVTVTVAVFQRAIENGLVASTGAVVADTQARIEKFLHPCLGGPAGAGWPAGQSVYLADLSQAITPAPDVGYVASMTMEAQVPLYHQPPLGPGGAWDDARERPFTLAVGSANAVLRLADYEQPCSALAPTGHVIAAQLIV